ncbi:hypothetical protein TNCT_679361, partial [Trichonephila clavata]
QNVFPWQRWDSNPRPRRDWCLNQRLRPLGHATVERPLVRSFTAHKLLILQNNVTILVKAKRISWQRWDSNPRPEETGALNQRLRPLGHATVERPLVRSFTAHKLLILQNNVNYSRKSKTYFPGSGGIRTHAPEETGALNQRLRPLGHATDERPLVRSFTAHKLLILQNNVTILVKAKRISWQRWDSNPRPEETGALNQRLRPLGHATVERPLVRSFTAHKLLILQNNVTILVKAKRISLAAVGFEPTPPKRLVP